MLSAVGNAGCAWPPAINRLLHHRLPKSSLQNRLYSGEEEESDLRPTERSKDLLRLSSSFVSPM